MGFGYAERAMNDITNNQLEELVRRACDIRKCAYAPYSGYLVGASLLTSDGTFFDGINVENASFGLTNCAERTAVFSAVAAGYQAFHAIAVASKGRFSPCGACRQVLAEFDPKMPVFLVDPKDRDAVERTSMEILLPSCFELPDADKR